MAVICPKCNRRNVKQVARRMKTKYGRVSRRFRCEDCGYTWAEENRGTSQRKRLSSRAF